MRSSMGAHHRWTLSSNVITSGLARSLIWIRWKLRTSYSAEDVIKSTTDDNQKILNYDSSAFENMKPSGSDCQMGRVLETEKYMEHVTSEFSDYPSWICSDLPDKERPILSSNASLFPPQPCNYSTALPKELCDVNEGLKQTRRQSTGVAWGTIWPQDCIESQMGLLHTLRLASTLHQQKSIQTQIKIKRGVKPVAAAVYSEVTSHRVFPCGCLLHPNAPSSRMHTWQESHRPECHGRLEIKCSKNDSSERGPGLIRKGGWLRWFWIFHGFKLQLHAWHGYPSPLIIHSISFIPSAYW